MNPPPQSPSASEFPTNAGNIGQCSAGWAGLGTDQPRSHLIWETGARKWSVATAADQGSGFCQTMVL